MNLPFGEKIVTSHEMARMEGDAFARGEDAEKFMDCAGRKVADLVQEYIEHKQLTRRITLLVGKGNNGGDAYVAGAELLQRGFAVEAFHLYSFEQCGPLCRAKAENFRRNGGQIHLLRAQETIEFPSDGILLDGLVGTGFKGKPEDLMARLIEKANQAALPIISIDIPSGVSGDSGEVGSVAIHATMTIYLGLPKLGFFIGKGFDHIGELKKADFGLKQADIENARAEGVLQDLHSWAELLPPIARTQHKYQRGYLLVWAGSPTMPGAALLCCMGALRGGAGIVRLIHDDDMVFQLASAPWEIVRQPLENIDHIVDQSARAGCMIVGPGLGRGQEVGRLLKKILQKIECPLIIDADGLYFVAHYPELLPAGTILTPHRGEIIPLIGKFSSDLQMIQLAQAFVEKYQVVLICKGAPTILFHPGQKPLFLAVGDPGMATAGAGDVLTGMIGAMRAAGLHPSEAAIAAICLHGKAGEIAAQEKGSRSVIASDLLEAIPKAYCLG